ncbi:ATP-grasp domain-containing protein [Herpetosiphon giganteus]|uniref:ATP-grasp domain-containing protein n=1 Tax=Herpetosiphon giganteus TaxID=2029754 RepID=UPI00195D44C0|nr:hypothetical protein [Herpetosiphon giganteus]MBM7843204.1 hypothetical protein [Herpetosiphon giganteus]
MNPNIRLLSLACERLGLTYEHLHSTENILRIVGPTRNWLFVNWKAPLNDNTLSEICRDKDYFYTLTHSSIKQPQTESYFHPLGPERFAKYRAFDSFEAIADDVLAKFALPVMIKRNRGSGGLNVFRCHDREAIIRALGKIFDGASKDFDYIALAQGTIDIAHEYRAVFLDGQLILLYEKNIDQALFEGNLSPLHWNGGKAVVIDDQALHTTISNFAASLFAALPLRWTGLDIAQDRAGEWWLIEANASPGFEYIARDAGDDVIVEVYCKVLETLGITSPKLAGAQA